MQLFSNTRKRFSKHPLGIFSKIFRTDKTPHSNMTVNGTTQGGLLSQSLLAKIDRLREANVGAFIPLPQVHRISWPPRWSNPLTPEQLVVVGDQSSGKSSVLESLTGFYFPRAAGLCTRYATQISCCRDPQKSVVISIIPRPDAGEELKAKLLKFRRQMTEIDNDELAAIFQDVCSHLPVACLLFSSMRSTY